MLQLQTFGLALFGFLLYVMWVTYQCDEEDTAHSLTPLDIIWRGAAKWKTATNLLFVAAVCFFFPPEFLEETVGKDLGGLPVGKGLPVIFGVGSECVMVKIFGVVTKAKARNGNG